jgi:hypothetical protein
VLENEIGINRDRQQAVAKKIIPSLTTAADDPGRMFVEERSAKHSVAIHMQTIGSQVMPMTESFFPQCADSIPFGAQLIDPIARHRDAVRFKQ